MLRLMRLVMLFVLAVALGVVLHAALRPAQAGAPSLAPIRLQWLSETYAISTADGLSLTLSADGQVTSLRIDENELVSDPAPALWLRDLSDAGSVITPNLVTNAGFEEGLAGWTQIANSGLEVSVVVSPTHSGGGALELTNPVTDTYRFAAYASDPVAVTPGQRYRLSAWFRSSTGYVSRPSGSPVLWQKDLWRNPPRTNGLYVQWFDADGHPLDAPQLATPLHWNTANWRIIRRELTAPPDAAQARAAIGALLTGQTLWVDDVVLVPGPEPDVPATGIVGPCPTSLSSSEFPQVPVPGNAGELGGTEGNSEGCLVQAVSFPESGLVITVTYTAHADHIAMHGEVVDIAGRDRALDLTWGVPMDAEGWTWWDDVHTSRSITDTGLYANVISAIYDGWLPISLYPYTALAQYQISNTQYLIPDTPALGLALAIPLNRPQLALLAYDGATGRFGITFHLGISPQAMKVGPRASFDLMLYRFDPAWGFRDVIARHRVIQPDAYTTNLPLYEYDGFEQGSYFTEKGAQQALADDEANIYSAQYTSSELHLKIAPSSDPRPTLEQVLDVVSTTLDSPRPWDAAHARAITESAIVDTNGDWSLKFIDVKSWAPDWWVAAWAANLDPNLDEGLAAWNLDWRITPAFSMTTQVGAHLDGVQIDNFMSSPALDLRPEALAAADWPLTYTPHTYQPVVHNGFALREYLTFLRDYLDTEWGTDRGITINFWGLGHPNYLAEYIDGFGGEGYLKGNGEGPNWNPEILDYRRAIAYSRPYMFANQMTGLTASEAYTFTRLALLYGVVAGTGPNAADWEPEAQRIVSDTAQLVTRYWAAGWEPLTYAYADSENIWVERFGGPGFPPVPTSSHEFPRTQRNSGELMGTEGVLYFTVHNHSEATRTATITIETTPLGLTDPASAAITDLATEQPVPFSVVDGDIVLTLALGPRETRVLQVIGDVAHPTPTPTPTYTPTATNTPTPTPTATPSSWLYLPLIFKDTPD